MKKNKNYVDLKDQPVPEGQHLLEVDDLKMYFHTEDGVVRAVDGVSYTLDRGETLGVVGESGSGKSVTAMTIMGLISMPPGKIEGGDVRYRGRSILEMTEEEMQHIRGNDIAMIFQDPMTSLNPVYKIASRWARAFVCTVATPSRRRSSVPPSFWTSWVSPSPRSASMSIRTSSLAVCVSES